MGTYREDRRADKVPRLSAVTANEAAEATDLRRAEQYQKEVDRLAAEQKKEPKRSFADLVKKK